MHAKRAYSPTCALAYGQTRNTPPGSGPRFNYQTCLWEIKTLTSRAGNGGDARGAHTDQRACNAATQQMTGGCARGIQKKKPPWRRGKGCVAVSLFWSLRVAEFKSDPAGRLSVSVGGVTNFLIKEDSLLL